MELDSGAYESFKNFTEFMQNWHTNNGIYDTQIFYDLFTELWEKEYRNQGFSEKASDFIDTLDTKVDEEWRNRWLIPFQNACVFYLFEEGTKRFEKFKNIIRDSPSLQISCQDYLLKPFQEQNNAYNEYLLQLDDKYKKYKWRYLFYAFHQIAAIEGFSVTRHVLSKSVSISGEHSYNYLCCPSKVHYSINPKETILIFIKNEDPEEGDSFYLRAIQDLDRLEPKPDKIFLFTLNRNLPSDLFDEGENFNLQFVTTKSIKNKCYANNDKVRTLEELLYLCKAKKYYWQNYKFSENEVHKIKQLFRKKIENHSQSELLKNWYQTQIDNLDNVPTTPTNILPLSAHANISCLKNIETNQLKLEKFKEFIQRWQASNDFEKIQSPYHLFFELLEEKYKGRSFFTMGSEFIEKLEEKFENKWQNELLDPFQNICFSYLTARMPVQREWTKNMIIAYLESEEIIDLDFFLNSVRNSCQYDADAFEELRMVLVTLKEHIDTYNEYLIRFRHNHDKCRKNILYSAFLQIGALEKFLITEENSKPEQIKYLFSPSFAHYLINPKETLLIVIKDDRWKNKHAIYQLNQHQSAVNKYLFTLDANLSCDFLSQCAESRIKIVTAKSIKEKHYASDIRIITLESLLFLFQEKTRFWQNYRFSMEEIEDIKLFWNQKLNEVPESFLLKNWYEKQINILEHYKRSWLKRMYW